MISERINFKTKMCAPTFAALFLGLWPISQAWAVCPICTFTVGSGLGISRWLGISDLITGLWLGGFLVSLIIWTISKLEKKGKKNQRNIFLTIIGYYMFVFGTLYLIKFAPNPDQMIIAPWLDFLLLGTVVGSFGFWTGANWYNYLKEQNGGKAHFPFQKVVMPLLPLIILSIIFQVLIK